MPHERFGPVRPGGWKVFATSATKDSRLADHGLVAPTILSDRVDSWVAKRRDPELFLFTTVSVAS